MKFIKLVSAAAALVASMGAQAAFINGGILATGTVANNGTTNHIVTTIANLQMNPGFVLTATNDVAPAGGMTSAYSFVVGASPSTLFGYNGFTFTVTNWGTNTGDSFSCAGLNCSDSLTYANVSGTISAAGYDTTGFTGGNFSVIGNCTRQSASVNACDNNVTAGWNANFSATGRPPVVVSAPASLALAGLGLSGIAALRRARKA